jgi:hypothetical protein
MTTSSRQALEKPNESSLGYVENVNLGNPKNYPLSLLRHGEKSDDKMCKQKEAMRGGDEDTKEAEERKNEAWELIYVKGGRKRECRLPGQITGKGNKLGRKDIKRLAYQRDNGKERMKEGNSFRCHL